MSDPSHTAASRLNKAARKHYPRAKAPTQADSHATDTAIYASALTAEREPLRFTPSPADIADAEKTADVDAAWANHKSDLEWPPESNDPFLLAIGVGALAILVIGALTLLGGLGFVLWQIGTAIFHSLH